MLAGEAGLLLSFVAIQGQLDSIMQQGQELVVCIRALATREPLAERLDLGLPRNPAAQGCRGGLCGCSSMATTIAVTITSE